MRVKMVEGAIKEGTPMKEIPPEIKKKVVREHIENARTRASLAAEYGVSKATISNWIRAYREECQTNDEAKNQYELMLELKRLRKDKAELEKEVLFLKKAAAFFAKEIG